MPSIPTPVALLDAIDAGNVALTAALLDQGADPNAREGRDVALSLAVWKGPAAYELVKLLVEHGALPNPRDGDGLTPLLFAVKYAGDNLPTIRYLVEKGADLSAKDNDGFDALKWATMTGNKPVEEIITQALERQQQLAQEKAHKDIIATFHQTALASQKALKQRSVRTTIVRPS